ncbi:hypothetical protein JYB87_02595 [Shewanella avicenniae]|uniref:Uncharacterized protein n=1 Tax=Shewanella avicenniae TaxID=2814294 RepID=A0ABX7QRS2_9GAMM|nr:hypothetical protein [Shewanella avicenniae]QSX34154.1 hypothetical protein JYB87_02595 [Shewanella avicenniae]
MFNTYSSGYDDIYSRINKLLPNALTAGLSSAYDAKITLETSELSGHKENFGRAIATLVLISLIPFGVDIYLLAALGKDLISVISDTPKLLLSILPLYLPVLWIAYSANKKSNLSKRLIEEYTHKGVLSKTFEGLSGQIKEIDDVGLSEELRAKLLFNLLQVNTENPGKLISDYKTTDHPVMDALDKSIKLSESLDKLKNIPGLTKLIAKLEKEREVKLAKTSKKVADGLNAGEIIVNGPKNSVKDIASESDLI